MAQASSAAPSAGAAHTWVYLFEEGNADRNLLGGKGAGLVEMTNLGLPVPPGFVIGTSCGHAYAASGVLPDSLLAEITERMHTLA